MITLDALIEQTDVPQTISYSPYAYEVSAAVAFGLYAMARGSKGRGNRTAQSRVARRRTWHTSQAVRNGNKDHLSVRNDDPHNQLVAYLHAQRYEDNPGFRPALYRQVNPYGAVTPDPHWYDAAIDKALSFPKWLFSRDKYEGSDPSDPINDLHPENVKRAVVVAGFVIGSAFVLSTALWYGLVIPKLYQ